MFPDIRAVENGGSRKSVGISIQFSNSEKEEFFVCNSMPIGSEQFDFSIEDSVAALEERLL